MLAKYRTPAIKRIDICSDKWSQDQIQQCCFCFVCLIFFKKRKQVFLKACATSLFSALIISAFTLSHITILMSFNKFIKFIKNIKKSQALVVSSFNLLY